MKKFVILNNVTNGTKLSWTAQKSLERLKEKFHVYMQNPSAHRKLCIPDALF